MALLEEGTDAVTDRESLRKEIASIGKPEFGRKKTWVKGLIEWPCDKLLAHNSFHRLKGF